MDMDMDMEQLRRALLAGQVIPAHPLALDAQRKLDERRQRALSRYYLAAGAGGLAVGVHTTQFAIHDRTVGLLQPVWELAVEEARRAREAEPPVLVAGIIGETRQAVREAEAARECGYHAGLLNVSAVGSSDLDRLVAHCSAVAEVLPVFGFYLQPGIGGCELPYAFWRRFFEIEEVVAVKIATFDRYRTIDVVRALAESGRSDVALYTGNDDYIIGDLVTPFRFASGDGDVTCRIVGGLLGQWAVWTRRAVEMLQAIHSDVASDRVGAEWLRLNIALTDANAAIFDAANGFAGVVPGVHEILRRQGLLEGIWCLDPQETLSPGQAEELDRVCAAYPELTDDAFIREHLDEWLSG